MAIEGLAPDFRFINTNGIRLHCAVQGEANAGRGTLVLLHGFPEFWYGWRYQIADLARDYRVVAPDLIFSSSIHYRRITHGYHCTFLAPWSGQIQV